MRHSVIAFLLSYAITTAAAAYPNSFSWKCAGGQVTANIVKKMNASYVVRMTNTSNETAHVFIEGYAPIECKGCEQRGTLEGKPLSAYAKPGKKAEEVIAATLLKLGRLDVKHYFYACGDAQFRHVNSKRLVALHKKSGKQNASSGANAANCLTVTPAEGRLRLKNTCSHPIQAVWCHLDKTLKYEKKTYCGNDGKGRYYTQSMILQKGSEKLLKMYNPRTAVRWGACKAKKLGAAGGWDGNGGYTCK